MKNIILFLIASILISSCGGKKETQKMVSVSILPQKYFVEQIAGDYVKVNVMVPPGMNPATCDLNMEQLKNLYDSQVYFAIGHLPFEITHLYPVLKKREDILLINHSTPLILLSGSCNHDHSHGDDKHHHHGVDPHIWLSPAYVQSIIKDIYTTLSHLYPEKKETFKENFEQLQKEVEKIDQQLAEVLAKKEHKSFLIYHPALTYLANDHDMEQISIENEGKEPGPAYLKEIIKDSKEKNIGIIFIQSQFDVENAKSVGEAINGEVIPIDPLNENWKEEMETLIRIFDEKLS